MKFPEVLYFHGTSGLQWGTASFFFLFHPVIPEVQGRDSESSADPLWLFFFSFIFFPHVSFSTSNSGSSVEASWVGANLKAIIFYIIPGSENQVFK